MLSTLSRETIHVGVLDAYDIGHVDKIESLERVGVSSRIDVRCLGAALCGVGGRPLFAVSITGSSHLASHWKRVPTSCRRCCPLPDNCANYSIAT